MTFGEEVKRLREAAGLSQTDLSKAAGIDQSFLSRIERGRSKINADDYLKLCDALGVDCNHFRPFLADDATG